MRTVLVAGQQRLTGIVTEGNVLEEGDLGKNGVYTAAVLKLIKLYMQGLCTSLVGELYLKK